MTSEPSPRPWRLCYRYWMTPNRDIFAANGDVVAACVPPDDAALIVDAVNERERLRDLVRRFADLSESLLANYEYRYREDVNSMAFVENTRGFLREARAAVGEGETPTGKGVGE